MKNLGKLLEMAAEKRKFCLVQEDGSINEVEQGKSGEVYSIESRIGFEIFGEWPLSTADKPLFEKLTKLHWRDEKPEKKAKKELVK